MLFTIGPLCPDRLPEVNRLLRNAKIGAGEDLSADVVLEATEGTTLVGCCALDFVQNVTIVHNLAVDKPVRRRGIGRALVEYSVGIAALRRMDHMVALTMFWNVNFFCKLGFATTSRKLLPASLAGRDLIFDPALRRATPMIRELGRTNQEFEMFLYTEDASLLRSDLTRVVGIGQTPGELGILRSNGAALAWSLDAFTTVHDLAGEIVIETRRPVIDREPVCELHWRTGDGVAWCSRKWSGEFGAYIKDQPAAMIASHVKFAALLKNETGRGWKRIEPGHHAQVRKGHIQMTAPRSWAAAFQMDYAETVREVRRLVLESVAAIPGDGALLLSGGIDSSVVAAAMRIVGRDVRAFAFGLDRPLFPQSDLESDLICARKVAAHLGFPLPEILLSSRLLIRNVPLGIYLAETQRGTIVDDCAALVEVARRIKAAGFSQVWMGEAADDLFGGFKFALRCYRGQQLRAYYRTQLQRDLPNELAIIQNVFGWFDVSVVHPLWTEELLRVGYNLPLAFRLDPRRLMKMVLREAFAAELPGEIVTRPKCVTRDSTQIRYALEKAFGKGRDRYRAVYHTMMGESALWPRNFRRLLKNSRS